MKILRGLALAAAALLSTAAGARADITLNFDDGELARDTTVDGLTFQGFTFDFAGPNPGDAFYNSAIFRPTSAESLNLRGGVLEGDSAGILTIDFARPTDILEFDVLLSVLDTVDPGFTVTLFDASLNSLGTTSLAVTPLVTDGFAEARFVLAAGPAVGRVVIDFDNNAGRFALDNLRAVPEPGGLILLGLGLSALAGWRLRRRLQVA